jgi:hypothetical protein
MSAPMVLAQNKELKTVPANYSITKNELKLSDAINAFRAKHELGELQLSPSLSFVARTHLNDIRLYSKDEHGCNMNSWSDKGKWIPCCFNEKQKNLDLMTSKPSEIIGFRGKGYEIVIASKKGVSTNDLLALWLNTKSTQDFIMNKGLWSNRNWQCMGISIYNGFASIWASEMPDRITDVSFLKEVSTKTTKTEPVTKAVEKVPLTRGTAQYDVPDIKYNSTEVKDQKPIEQPVTKPSKPVQIEPVKGKAKTEPITETVNSVTQDKGTSYFLVHSSYTSLPDAVKTFESLKKDGFKNLVMIDARGKYRIALGIYTTEAAAVSALHQYSPKFDQLIIYIF